jgi:hypothetical protein
MRKRDLPLPADFITDAVSVMDPRSRGGMGFELGSFTAAWPEITVEVVEHRPLEMRHYPALADDAAG